jgi:hypothetical protein
MARTKPESTSSWPISIQPISRVKRSMLGYCCSKDGGILALGAFGSIGIEGDFGGEDEHCPKINDFAGKFSTGPNSSLAFDFIPPRE